MLCANMIFDFNALGSIQSPLSHFMISSQTYVSCVGASEQWGQECVRSNPSEGQKMF